MRRNGTLIAGDSQQHIDTIRTIAQQDHLSETCLGRIEKAERVVPKRQATIAFVSGEVRQQVSPLVLTQPESYAMHAHLRPSFYLDRVASTRTVTAGESRRALAERLRTPLCAPDGAFGALSPVEQDQLKDKAKALAEVCQRSRSNVEGRNGALSLRNHQLRGLDHPRKRACLSALQLLSHADRRDDCSGAVLRAEASVDVCGDPGIRGDTASASQSTAASHGLDQRAQGGRRHDQGQNARYPYLDEVFLTINGKRHYLWRAVDQDDNVLDILVQSRRHKQAAKKFFRKLLKGLQYVPRVIITDKLKSCAAKRELCPASNTARVAI